MRRADGLAVDPDERLIHPDCMDPAAEFGGWLDRMIREGRAAGAGDDAMLAELQERADRLESDLGGEP